MLGIDVVGFRCGAGAVGSGFGVAGVKSRNATMPSGFTNEPEAPCLNPKSSG